MPEHVWQAHGLDKADQEESIAFCEKVFADTLQGESLMTNARNLRGSAWLNFQRVVCEQWWLKNAHGSHVVLMGDAVHTAHFAIGSGTKLAIEDAIELTRQFQLLGDGPEHITEVLTAYQEARRVETLRLQNAAWNAMEWFEVCGERYCDQLEPEQFMYSMLTRSQRISHENLRLRDGAWLEGYERWLAERAGVTTAPNQKAPPPMFTPYTLRGVTLKNRIVVSPMAQYSAVDGVPGDYHLVHLGARAMGGAGLVFAEMTCVSPEGRITPGCPGLYTDEQAHAFARIADWIHTHTDAKFGIQIGHAGAKASTRVAWEGADQPLVSGNWPLVSASPQQYLPGVSQVSRAMTRADMDAVKAQFVAATRRADAAGADWLELHCAHGYLLSGFISPLTNQREDEYGGTLENRLRYPLEVFAAVRAAWPRRQAHFRAHFGQRLGGRRHHPERRGRHCQSLQGGRCGHDGLLLRPSEQTGKAGLRPHVPDPVRRPHPPGSRNPDDCRGRHQRGRPRQQHPGGRTRRPVRRGAAAPGQPGLDAHRGGEDRLPARGVAASQYQSAKGQMEANFVREKAQQAANVAAS
jgi:anthraniloyl-CoA monooxygenase